MAGAAAAGLITYASGSVCTRAMAIIVSRVGVAIGDAMFSNFFTADSIFAPLKLLDAIGR